MSQMSEHTKGPWICNPDDTFVCNGMGCFAVYSDIKPCDGQPVLVALIPDISSEVWPAAGSAEANMRLAKAAPDLLAACQRTKEILDSWGPGRWGETLRLLHERMSKAIAKAGGG